MQASTDNATLPRDLPWFDAQIAKLAGRRDADSPASLPKFPRLDTQDPTAPATIPFRPAASLRQARIPTIACGIPQHRKAWLTPAQHRRARLPERRIFAPR